MAMKKTGLFVLGIVFMVFLLNFASAQYYGGFYDPRQGMSDLINIAVDFFEPLLQVVFGGEVWNGSYLFESFLLFILLVSLVYLSISKINFFKERAVVWIIAIGVPLIGIRFISIPWLHAILVQYMVLAIALTAALPFIIYFFFLYNVFDERYPAMRKVGWIFFACLYIGMWVTAEEVGYSAIYFWTALAAFIFLLLDGTISRHMLEQKIKAAGSRDIWDHIVKLQEEKNRYMNTPGIPEDIKDRRVREIEDALKKYYKQVY